MSRSRKHTLCPRALRARTSARKVVACPLPHEEVMERPKITMSNGLVMYLMFVGARLPAHSSVEKFLPVSLHDPANAEAEARGVDKYAQPTRVAARLGRSVLRCRRPTPVSVGPRPQRHTQRALRDRA